MQRYSNLPSDEVSRLNALNELKILDSPFETLFDCITQNICKICFTPIALISFVDEDRQWFKSKIGIDGTVQTPKELDFCAQTILHDDIVEIKDTLEDDRFKDNPLVIGDPHIRFFAGAPILLPLGEKIGALCVIDTKPNELDAQQKLSLEGFAKVISQILVVRSFHLHKVNQINN